MSSLLSDDWSKNDTETWKAKKLGDCGTKEFKVQKNLLLTLSKTGKSQLLVDHITVIGQSPDKKNPELEQFKCNSYDIGKNKLPKETKVCTTHPYHYQQIEKAIFQIGNFIKKLRFENYLLLMISFDH